MAFKTRNIGNNDNRNTRDNDREEQVPAKVWMNIGFAATDEDTGEDVFISLPRGLAIDLMAFLNAGNSKIMQSKNALLKHVQDVAADMEPGEEFIVDGLQIQLRHVQDREAPSADTNSMIGAVSQLELRSKAA